MVLKIGPGAFWSSIDEENKMKIRQGFVSNSSSSSFMIALDANAEPIIKLQIEVNLTSCWNSKKISDLKELDEYFWQEYHFDNKSDRIRFDNKWLANQYDEAKAAIEKGKKIYIGEVSSEDDNAVSNFIYENGLNAFVNQNEIEIIKDAN